MGFYLERYNNNTCGLIVSFASNTDSLTFFSGDSIEAAMKHFGVYLDENKQLQVQSEEAQALGILNVTAEEATELRTSINALLVSLDDETADTNKILFPLWSDDSVAYTTGERVRYNGVLYKVLQAHTSQSDWTPDAAVSLFARCIEVSIDGDGNPTDEIAEWVQPDSTNPYMTSDRVMFEGQVYESLIDNNVWSPSAYPQGWQLIEE